MVLVDALHDLVQGRSTLRTLAAMGLDLPVVAVVGEGALAVVDEQWPMDDLILVGAAPAEVAARVKEAARAVGFDRVGITNAAPSAHGDFLEGWLAAGRHGTMGYLARPDAVERRRDSRRSLDRALAIVDAVANAVSAPVTSTRTSIRAASRSPSGASARTCRASSSARAAARKSPRSFSRRASDQTCSPRVLAPTTLFPTARWPG